MPEQMTDEEIRNMALKFAFKFRELIALQMTGDAESYKEFKFISGGREILKKLLYEYVVKDGLIRAAAGNKSYLAFASGKQWCTVMVSAFFHVHYFEKYMVPHLKKTDGNLKEYTKNFVK